jgi:PAS domain S-box-containing protein
VRFRVAIITLRQVRGENGAVVLATELDAVPWPALLVGADGVVLGSSPSAVKLLGTRPSHVAELEERFEMLSASGRPVPEGDHPLRRAARGEPFEVAGTWRDRESGRELSLRFRGRAVGPYGLLEIDSIIEDAGQRAAGRLSKLNEALLGRTPRQGLISIRDLLLQLVLQACELTGARYGALGVLAADGASLKEFVHVGVPEDTAARIGHLPEGKGLLGTVIREASTIRVSEIGADPRSVGFPASHPPMTSFLGVPIRVGNDVFGNFYLTDKQGGGGFTEEDAQLLERFSAQASLTVAYARQAEQVERRLFETVVQFAPHGIVFFPVDVEGQVLGNPAAERILGRITRGNDPARTYDLKHPDGSPMADEELPSMRALRGEAVVNLEALIERRHGRPIPALISGAPVRSESGARLGAVMIFQDITALKQLQHLSQEFLALVAHDMRTPLQSVLLQLDVLVRGAQGIAAQVPMTTLHAMRRSGQQLERLVSDLLDASRVEAHGVTLDLTSVNLPELVSTVVSQVQGLLRAHPVTVEISGAPTAVAADPRRLEQIVTNLLENAVKYSDEGTPLRIVVAASERGATLSVHDRGPGISVEELPRLFDRYFQTQRARAKRSGLGLGLFITKGLVEAHGGTITVESVLGRGSAFHVWLPAVPRQDGSNPVSAT